MSTELLNIETVAEYNDMLGVETLHPLVSVIDLSKARPMRHLRHTFSFYTICLKDEKTCELIYGRKRYDYTAGSVVCLAPGQVIGIDDTGEVFQPKGWALCFDPELLRGTSLARSIREYTYFSYEVNEALHLSVRERAIFLDCLSKISLELDHAIDRLSRRLIANNIELLLNYCLRFYERQFITRQAENSSIMTRFDRLLESCFADKNGGNNPDTARPGLPSVKWCASQLCLSSNYFGDLIKKETGRSAKDYIVGKIISKAKDWLYDDTRSISQVAYGLGFEYPQHFSRMFKSVVGMSPNEYRTRISAD